MKKQYLTLIVLLIIAQGLIAQIKTIDWRAGEKTNLQYTKDNIKNSDNFYITINKLPDSIKIIHGSSTKEIAQDGVLIKDKDDSTTANLFIVKALEEIDLKSNLDNEATLIFVLEDENKKKHQFTFTFTDDSTDIPKVNGLSDAQKQQKIDKYVQENYKLYAHRFHNPKTNLIITGNTVHIFLDEFQKTYFTGFPTTAREDFNYTFHVFYYDDGKGKNIKAAFTGVYNPSFEIYGASEVQGLVRTGPSTSSSSDTDDVLRKGVKELVLENVGPFTSSFNVKIIKKKEENETEEVTIANRVIQVAKTHHISVSAGLVGTFLKNPTAFEKYPLSNGDSTVVADDPTTRGMVTLMATFYPKPRNLLFAPTNWKERIGFVVGTRIDKDFNENFIGGISYDLARGVSLSAGAHYGRVNKLVNAANDFEYGETVYEGELKTKKVWEVGFYCGVNIDLRVFGLLFNPQPIN